MMVMIGDCRKQAVPTSKGRIIDVQFKKACPLALWVPPNSALGRS
jgi:hypothetical protein